MYPNQVVTLGVNLNALQAKFDALRDSDEWVSMRRSVRAERDEASKLQDLRRSQISGDVSFGASAPAPVMSSILYRNSERQMADTLQKLWTRYYQTLIDSVEQRRRAGAAGCESCIGSRRGAASRRIQRIVRAKPPGWRLDLRRRVAGVQW